MVDLKDPKAEPIDLGTGHFWTCAEATVTLAYALLGQISP